MKKAASGLSYQQSGIEWGEVGFMAILAPRFKVKQSDKCNRNIRM